MDKNSIIGIVLIAAIFVVMGVLNKPSEEEQARRLYEQDSLKAVRTEQSLKVQEQEQTRNTTRQSVDSSALVQKEKRYGTFGSNVYGEKEFYTIENDLLVLTVSTQGGRPYSVQLKGYQTFDSIPLHLFNGDSTVFNLQFYNNGSVSTNDLFFSSDDPKKITVSKSEQSLSMKLMSSESSYLEYVYTVKPGSYEVGMQIKFNGIEDPTNRLSYVDLAWELYSPRQEKGWKNESMYTSIYYKPDGDEVDHLNARTKKETQPEDLNYKVEWIAFKDQFFASVIMAEKAFSNAYIEANLQEEDSDYIKQFKSTIALPYNDQTQSIPLSFYFGPNKYKLLKKEFSDRNLQDLVEVGGPIIKWINRGVIINLFEWLSKYFANYGIIILLLTIIIKAALLPLTFKSYMSQAKMRVVKPMVDEATKKITKEKTMERQQATMGIYKKVGVSPMGGCLPMVLQMPILFAMFRFFPTSIELRHQGFLWAHDLSTYDDLIHWDSDIWLLGTHLSLFTVLMTVTTIISMKTNSSAQMSDSQMPGMKTMMYIMPVTFLFVLNDYSAGLTYYYFLANLITFGQNFLFKLFVDEEQVLKKLQAKKVKPKKKSKWQQRIEEMQKMQQQQGKRR